MEKLGEGHGQPQLGSVVSFRASCWRRALGKADTLPRGMFVPPLVCHHTARGEPQSRARASPVMHHTRPHGCAPKHRSAPSPTTDQSQPHHRPAPPSPWPWHPLAALGRPRGAGFGRGDAWGMQQGSARYRVRLAQHAAAIPPNTPIPPSPAPGEPRSSPRVFPRPRPSSQAVGSSPAVPGTQPFLRKRKRGRMRRQKGQEYQHSGLGDYL